MTIMIYDDYEDFGEDDVEDDGDVDDYGDGSYDVVAYYDCDDYEGGDDDDDDVGCDYAWAYLNA